MKTSAVAVLIGIFSGVVLAQQPPDVPRAGLPKQVPSYEKVDQYPGDAPRSSTALTDLVKAQTEAIKALEARVTKLEERVKKLESPR